MITAKRKIIDNNLINSLAKKTNLSSMLVELLCMRGVDTEEKIRDFFDYSVDSLTSPFVIKDMDKAVEFVNNAVKNKKRILIYGDYDCDGVTSTAVLKKYFNSINYKVDYYLPDRELEGYGLSKTSINNFISMFNPEVVITVDCGVSNYDEVEYLQNECNVQVLVTDHHQIGEKLPNCIVINPKTSDNVLTDLAGVGVAYKLVEALSSRQFSSTLLDIVSIGTIADLVSLMGENRKIVRLGLDLLNQNKIKGIVAIKNVIKKYGDLTEGDIGYTIAPMINSIGRMGNANKVVDMFLSDDNFYLTTTALKLDKLNNERKFMCDAMFDDALKMLNDYDFVTNKVIVLYSKNWKTGILGIVSSRIVEEYNLPVILFGTSTDDVIKGSARSAGGINLYDMLATFKDNFISFGGHSGAAGLSIKKDYLPGLIKDLNSYITSNNLVTNLKPKLTYDIRVNQIDKQLYDDIQQLSPFGMCNPIPKLLIDNNSMFVPFAKKHIKAEVNSCDIIAFNELDNLSNYNNNSLMIVKANVNNFNGVTKYQGIVEKNVLVGKANDDYSYIVDYFKDLLYKSQDCRVNYISDYSDMLNNIDDIFGTLFVAYSPKTYNTFIDVVLKLPKYKNKYFVYDIKNRSSIAPYNRVVLSPSKNFDFSGYKKIIFIETPINMVYHNNIKNAYVVEDNYPFVDTIKNTKISREFLSETYLLFKQAILSKERGLSVEDWYNILHNGYSLDCSLLEFNLAFSIFYELGFFTIGSGFSLALTTVKKPLENSKIFTSICKIKEI